MSRQRPGPCIFLLALLLLLVPLQVRAGREPEDGYWKLERVEQVTLQSDASFSHFENRGSLHLTATGPGGLSGGGRIDTPEDDLLASWEGKVSWTPPPEKLQPGTPLALNIAESYSSRQGDAVFGGLSGEGFVLEVEDCGIAFDEDTMMKGHDLKEGRTFEAPTRTDSTKDMLIWVAASVTGPATDPFDIPRMSVAQVFRYRWTLAGPRKIQGRLEIRATHGHSGAVEGAGVRFRVKESGEEKEAVTGAGGVLETSFEAESRTDSLTVEMLGVFLTGSTRYKTPQGDVSSRLAERVSAPWSGRAAKLVLDVKNGYGAKGSFDVSLFRLRIASSRLDPKTLRWEPSPARADLLRPGGNPLVKLQPDEFVPAGESCVAELLLPTREFLGTPTLTLRAFEKQSMGTDTATVKVPTARESSATVLAWLYLCDDATKVARWRVRMREYLEQPTFRNVLTKEEIDRIVLVRIEIDPGGAQRCENGVIYVPAIERLALTNDENCDNFFHEWAHHLVEVAAEDPGVEDEVGGVHEGGFFQLNVNPETAWDEGRAHFLSALWTMAFKLPNSTARLNEQGAAEFLQQHAGTERAGNRSEGVVATALLQYYRDAGYRSTRNILRDFLAVQRFAADPGVLGHPPRTAEQFFDVLRRYNQRSQLSTGGPALDATIDRLCEQNRLTR